MRPSPIMLSETDRALLDAEAERTGSSRAAIVRRLIREHLRQQRPQEVSR